MDSLNRLLDNSLNGLNRLLNILDLLNNFLSRGVDDLSFDGLIFNSFLDSFLRNILNISVLVNLGDVFSLVFDSIVVGDSSFSGNILDSFDFFVFHNAFFVRDVFDSGFSSDGLSHFVDLGGSDVL